MNKTVLAFAIGIIALIGGGIFLLSTTQNTPNNLAGFASCLKEKKAVFYGAFWCPHCQNQKKMFGNAEKFLPYVECSTPDGKKQLDVCKEKDIKSYPTWEFSNGQRLTGEIPLEKLAQNSGCELPQ